MRHALRRLVAPAAALLVALACATDEGTGPERATLDGWSAATHARPAVRLRESHQ